MRYLLDYPLRTLNEVKSIRDSQGSMSARPRISVIIPVRNQARKIEKSLEAVLSQSVEPFEVIVVDGYSTDDTVEIAKRFRTKILYETYGTRGGANQVGIDHAKGDYIAFTDADCIPEQSWLENLVKEFDEGIVGVGGVVKNIGSSFIEDSINAAMESFLGSAMSVQGRVFTERRFARSISGCNCMYRKKDLLDVGGFDVNLTTAEDTELNARLRKIGKLIYTPQAVILHDHSRGLKEFAKRMFQYGFGRAASRITDLQVVPPLVIPVLLMSIFFLPFLLPLSVVIYLIVVVTLGIVNAVKKRDARLWLSTSVVYLVEHISYAIGFWRGILSFRSGRRTRRRASV